MYIAKSDFPQRWPNLLPELFAQLQVRHLRTRRRSLAKTLTREVAVQHEQRSK